ncbi:translin-like protein [Dissophora ornata]|nr:translin-like protein [Dissophora ornata]
MSNVVDLGFFDAIQAAMEAEAAVKDNIRTAVRELDRSNRTITAVLNRVHSSPKEQVPALCAQARIYFSEVQIHIREVAKIVPMNQYYKYNGLWSTPMQQACYLATLTTYLEHERLITIEELEGFFPVKVDLDNNMTEFRISIEEFLHGVVSLTNELSRLAVNAVTAGDFARPVRIGKFLKELYSGFQLLNLKNDLLRKRFDGIKYDIKKVEEIIYDLTVRKLIATDAEPAQAVDNVGTDLRA